MLTRAGASRTLLAGPMAAYEGVVTTGGDGFGGVPKLRERGGAS